MITQIIHIALGKANPMKMNGVNKVVFELATHQNKIIPTQFWGITDNPVHNYPEREFSTTLFKKNPFRFKLDGALVKALKKIDPLSSVVHLHGGFIPENFTLSKKLKQLNIPYFFTPHGAFNTIALKKSNGRKKIYRALFDQKLIQNAVGIQTLGESEWEAFQNQFGDRGLHLIPNGQKLDDAVNFDKKPEGLNLCFLGRIDIHTKGLDLIIEGIKKLKNENLNLKVIGDGGEIEVLREMVIKNGLEGNVTFSGAMFGDDKMRALAASDALILLSRNEGLPGVVLEAASVKTPVIVSKGTNFINFVKQFDSGYCVEPNTPENIKDVLENVLAEKQNGKILVKGENALKMVKETFDWEQITRKLIDAYVT